jgi:carbon-monoxide dehydrogenase medium subunit
VKLPAFVYRDPGSVDEALGLLEEQGARARVLAGGQSLLPLLKARVVRPAMLIDIGRIGELRTLRADRAGLVVGAGCRQRDLERHPGLSGTNPPLAQALPLMGHPQVRNRGTICGSLAHAHPAAELPAVAVAEGAAFTLRTRSDCRTVAAEDFYSDPWRTVRRAEELLTQATFPVWQASDGWAVEELARRQGDFPLAGVVVILTPDAERRVCARARLTVFGQCRRPLRIRRAEERLEGAALGGALLGEVSAAVSQDAEVVGDAHTPAPYVRQVLGALTVRAVRAAAVRAGLRTEGARG